MELLIPTTRIEKAHRLSLTAYSAFLIIALSFASSCASAAPKESALRTFGGMRESARYTSTLGLSNSIVPPRDNTTVITPHSLDGGSSLTVIAPAQWNAIAEHLTSVIKRAHGEYAELFGGIIPVTITFRLMDRKSFLEKTGAPQWTNALYYKQEILIPLHESKPFDKVDLIRSVRHEYLHSVIHALSGGRCPGWLDEGLAQWAEGSENTALHPALLKWIRYNPPVPLSLLQGGFTKLEGSMVPAAYAESLFASNLVISTFGFKAIRKYFDELRSGKKKSDAFVTGFGVSELTFERGLGAALRAWENRR